MTHSVGNPTDIQRRRGWSFGIGMGLASAAMASGVMLAVPASAAVFIPSSVITVPTDDGVDIDVDDLRPYPFPKDPNDDPLPPKPPKNPCEKKPWLPDCGPFR
ncbi:hypothetical protein StrepF001_27530 [Streptomyces sp. F001]|uniref:hypothetical protein n=1 Tax=Streptomyces sp. F001 TaxID=1510026 RepID=UPI00101E3A69|nr:hypothetical protein [Streptomyces sp. F001]RZB16432.1 hypothetical protein StrepF001_27530 [Streptomyces sp. F001]